MARKKGVHYVDNKKFLQALIEWREENDKKGEQQPTTNYTYREEMISDGIENCLQYVNNFNPEKSTNPFAYFTQIIYYAFLRRIAKEKKQTHVKNKMIEKGSYESWTTMEGDSRTYQVGGFDPLIMLPEEDVYKPKKKETTRKKKGLETFMEKDN
jgi:hypothetical protein